MRKLRDVVDAKDTEFIFLQKIVESEQEIQEMNEAKAESTEKEARLQQLWTRGSAVSAICRRGARQGSFFGESEDGTGQRAGIKWFETGLNAPDARGDQRFGSSERMIVCHES